jgi:type IX secretion system substrate protein
MKSIFLLLVLSPIVVLGQKGTITTICGNGTPGDSGDGSLAISATIQYSGWGIIDVFGNYYFQQDNSKVRKINTAGIISTIAGTGIAGYGGDGFPASSAILRYPDNIATDTLGNIYIADNANSRIRKVDAVTGIISTFAGTGTSGFSGDGLPATSAELSAPYGLCSDHFGNIYVYDQTWSVIRKINATGYISTIAGTPGIPGLTGDGGPATSAELTDVEDLYCDSRGNIYLSGANIRMITVSSGVISLVAGVDTFGFSGDGGPATAAKMNIAKAITFSSNGLLYFADQKNNRIRMIDSFGIIHTVVGNGTQGFFGDGGKDTSSELYWPEGVAFDSCDNLYINDNSNLRIRKVTYPITPASITVSAPAIAAIGSTVTATAVVANAGTKYSIDWMNHGTVFATTTVPTVTYTKTMPVDMITAKITPNACHDTALSESAKVSSPQEDYLPPGMQSVSIYPNPANDVLHMDNLPASAGYRMLTVVGAVVQQGSLQQGDNSISIATLPRGMYLLEAGLTPALSKGEGAGPKTTMKIIKQ